MRLRDLREDHDLTQVTLAQYLHIRQNTYSQYETGLHQVPLDVLVRLALLYDTSVDYLLSVTDQPEAYPRARALALAWPTAAETSKEKPSL